MCPGLVRRHDEATDTKEGKGQPVSGCKGHGEEPGFIINVIRKLWRSKAGQGHSMPLF